MFIEISFTISDCPLANTESLAWKCSCRVCIKPSNISMQHGIQVPENFCVSVFFLAGKPFTLSNTLTITNHKPWNKNRLGNFPKSPKPAPPRDPWRPKSHPGIASELQGSHLGHLMRCKPGKTKALHRCSDQHTSTNPERKNALIHVFGLAVIFVVFLMANKKKWWKSDKQGRDIVRSAFL